MKSRYLLPFGYQFLGIAFLIADVFLRFVSEDGFYKTFLVFLIVGLLLIAFSKEKIEDEQIGRLRLESLQWSICFRVVHPPYKAGDVFFPACQKPTITEFLSNLRMI